MICHASMFETHMPPRMFRKAHNINCSYNIDIIAHNLRVQKKKFNIITYDNPLGHVDLFNKL